jgi:hypothetical protein
MCGIIQRYIQEIWLADRKYIIKKMGNLPTIKLGEKNITRLIMGGNPLRGNSHFSAEMDKEMLNYYTTEKVVETLHSCEKAGINTLQARGDYIILQWLEIFRREGGNLLWIAQTASEMHDIFQNIRVCAAAGAFAIYHHGTRTDNLWHEGKIDMVKDYLSCIRDTGALVGLGTHNPEIIEYVEDRDWDVDFYMACFYNLSRAPRESAIVSGRAAHETEKFFDEDREKMCAVIRKTAKPCLAFKILAACRKCSTQESVEEAFRYAFANIKPIDAVVVGMFPKYIDQISLNVRYALRACAKLQ